MSEDNESIDVLLLCLVDQVVEMRRLQLAFFAGDRSMPTLRAAKKIEREVDKTLAKIERVRFPPVAHTPPAQSSLF